MENKQLERMLSDQLGLKPPHIPSSLVNHQLLRPALLQRVVRFHRETPENIYFYSWCCCLRYIPLMKAAVWRSTLPFAKFKSVLKLRSGNTHACGEPSYRNEFWSEPIPSSQITRKTVPSYPIPMFGDVGLGAAGKYVRFINVVCRCIMYTLRCIFMYKGERIFFWNMINFFPLVTSFIRDGLKNVEATSLCLKKSWIKLGKWCCQPMQRHIGSVFLGHMLMLPLASTNPIPAGQEVKCVSDVICLHREVSGWWSMAHIGGSGKLHSHPYLPVDNLRCTTNEDYTSTRCIRNKNNPVNRQWWLAAQAHKGINPNSPDEDNL